MDGLSTMREENVLEDREFTRNQYQSGRLMRKLD